MYNCDMNGYSRRHSSSRFGNEKMERTASRERS